MSNMTFSPLPSTPIGWPLSSIHMVVPPKTTNHSTEIADGANITTVTNSRSVRPLEILAMNMPTNGDHEVHQAQYIIVQLAENSDSTSPWLGATDSIAKAFWMVA